MNTYKKLMSIKEKGAGYLVLIDPDKKPLDDLIRLAKICESAGIDGLLVGGASLKIDDFLAIIRAAV